MESVGPPAAPFGGLGAGNTGQSSLSRRVPSQARDKQISTCDRMPLGRQVATAKWRIAYGLLAWESGHISRRLRVWRALSLLMLPAKLLKGESNLRLAPEWNAPFSQPKAEEGWSNVQ